MRFTLSAAMMDPAHYLPVATAADEAGFDSIAVPDSIFYPEVVTGKYPYTPDGSRFWGPEAPFIDPLAAMPAMAAVTRRVHIYSSVLKLPIRHPLPLAKTVASMAVLSNNRIGLGVGLSWMPEEFTFCHTEFATRADRTDEAIEIIRLASMGGWFEYHGKHYDFDRMQMPPAPAQPVPIYVGGITKPALRRAARLGDGWIAVHSVKSDLAGLIGQLRGYLEEYGRERVPFRVFAAVTDVAGADSYRRMEEMGVTDLTFTPWTLYGGDPSQLQTKLDAVRRFGAEVIAKVR